MRIFFKVIGYLLLAIIGLIAIAAAVGYQLSSPQSAAQLARNAKSPQFKDGVFHNVEPSGTGAEEDNGGFFGDEQRVPLGTIPVVTYDPGQLQSAPSPGLAITWLGHATALVDIDGVRVLIDPVFGQRTSPFSFVGPQRFHPPPLPLAKLTGIDAVVISHDHYDHLEEATFRHLAGTKTKLLVPLGLGDLLASWGIGADQIVEMDWWQEVELNGVKLVATPARHYANRGFFDFGKSIWLSWSLVGPEHRVFYSGDTGYSTLFAEVGERFGPFDVALIKIGAYGPGQDWHDWHMPPEEAMMVHQDVQAQLFFPFSWGTFNLAYHRWDEPIVRTLAAAQQAGITLVTPLVGETVIFDQEYTNVSWWEAVD